MVLRAWTLSLSAVMVLVAGSVWAGQQRLDDVGRARVIDVTYTAFHNYDQAGELFTSDDSYYVVPRFGSQPINAWCVYDEKTLRTTKEVRGCSPSELIFEDGVPACYEKAYLSIDRSRALRTCAEESGLGDGAAVCSRIAWNPAPSRVAVREMRLVSGGGDDREVHTTGKTAIFELAPCTGH